MGLPLNVLGEELMKQTPSWMRRLWKWCGSLCADNNNDDEIEDVDGDFLKSN
jgi:hypothetical protein